MTVGEALCCTLALSRCRCLLETGQQRTFMELRNQSVGLHFSPEKATSSSYPPIGLAMTVIFSLMEFKRMHPKRNRYEL